MNMPMDIATDEAKVKALQEKKAKNQALKDMKTQGVEYSNDFDMTVRTQCFSNPGFKRTIKPIKFFLLFSILLSSFWGCEKKNGQEYAGDDYYINDDGEFECRCQECSMNPYREDDWEE